jgi:sulfatase modifying factor 1
MNSKNETVASPQISSTRASGPPRRKNRLPAVMSSAAVAGLVLALGSAAQAQGIGAIEMVTVGDPGNAAYNPGGDYTANRGAVAYEYKIGKYEVTKDQWYDFNTTDGSGVEGSALPATLISASEWGGFCDWLTDGSSTDAGYYADGSTLSHDAWVADNGPTYFIPTHDEWHKAAFYDPEKGGAGAPGYWMYPTRSDTEPTGESTPGGTNSASSNRNPDHSIEVGLYPNTFSHYGTFDQAGNLWELVSPIGLLSTEASIRGASYHSRRDVLEAMQATYERDPYFSDSNPEAGFRVVLVEPGSAGPFAITAIDYDPDADTVTLTWRSRSNTLYRVMRSTDLSDWSNELVDSIGSEQDENTEDGAHITFSFDLVEEGLDSETDLFFRIEEQAQ